MFGIPTEQSENESMKHKQETEEKQENADKIGKTEEKIHRTDKGQSLFIVQQSHLLMTAHNCLS